MNRTILMVIVVGTIAGFCEGATGAGWGVFTLAMLVYIGVKPLEAVSTSILVELILGVVNNYVHFQAGAFNRRIGLPLLASGLISVYLGGRWGSHLPERVFRLFIALATLFLGAINLMRCMK